MKKKYMRGLSLLLAFSMCLSLMQFSTFAAEPEELEKAHISQEGTTATNPLHNEESEVIQETITYVNPIYADEVQPSDLLTAAENGISTAAEQDYCTTIEEAGAQMRQQMTERKETITIYYETTDSNYSEVVQEISDEAVIHTGVPTEGDYLKFQYGGWNCSLTRRSSNGIYYLTLSYTVTYYTTAEQEAAMDDAVTALLGQLDLDGKHTYEKIKGVYDYICETVTYDYDNLEDDSYVLKATAYAALVNKTAVCQGYAVLVYRLLEELGVDCRVICGTGNGGPHAWNIAGIDGRYYNLDATWDAVRSPYQYYLKSNSNFEDHIRDDIYDTAEFNALYPMGSSDYVYSENREEVASGTCGENLTWTLDADGTLTISGTGAMEDYDTTGYNDEGYKHTTNCPWGDDIQKVVIKDGVTSIGNYAFYGCEDLTSITLPDSVVTIGESAFEMCGMTSITLSDSVTSIGSFAFYGCDLTSITIPDNVTSIEDWTFFNAPLVSITIPSSVTYIGQYNFDTLKDIYYGGAEEQWNSIEIGANYLANATIHYNSTGLEEEGDKIPGDVNGDGKVTFADYAKILSHVKKKTLLEGEELARADVNGDGKVTFADYAKVLAIVKKQG